MRVIVFVAFSLIAMVSCSDDTQKTDTTTTKLDGQAKAEASAPKELSIKEGGGGSGACTNAADGPLIDTPAKRDAVSAKAKTCGLGCLASADKPKCSTDCVVKETSLSAGCAGCYAGIILCSMENCLTSCGADPSSAACLKCMNGDNTAKVSCYAKFYTCSGLTPPAGGG